MEVKIADNTSIEVPSGATYGEWEAAHIRTNQSYRGCRYDGDGYVFDMDDFSIDVTTTGDDVLFGIPETSTGELFPNNEICYQDDYVSYSGYNLYLYDMVNSTSARTFYVNAASNALMATDVLSGTYVTKIVRNDNRYEVTVQNIAHRDYPAITIVFNENYHLNCVYRNGFGYVSYCEELPILEGHLDNGNDQFLRRASVFPQIHFKTNALPLYGEMNMIYTGKYIQTDAQTSLDGFIDKDEKITTEKKTRRYVGKMNGGITIESSINDNCYGVRRFDDPLLVNRYYNRINDLYTEGIKNGEFSCYPNEDINDVMSYFEYSDVFSYEISEGCIEIGRNDLNTFEDDADFSGFFPEILYLSAVTGTDRYKCFANTSDGGYNDNVKFYCDSGNVFSSIFFVTDSGGVVYADYDSEIIETSASIDNTVRQGEAQTGRILHSLSRGNFTSERYKTVLNLGDAGGWEYVNKDGELIQQISPNTRKFNFIRLKAPVFRSRTVDFTGFYGNNGLTALTGHQIEVAKSYEERDSVNAFTFPLGGYSPELDPDNPETQFEFSIMPSSIVGIYEKYDEKDNSSDITKKRVKTRIIKIYTGKDIVILE